MNPHRADGNPSLQKHFPVHDIEAVADKDRALDRQMAGRVPLNRVSSADSISP
jgi:hypothetical protein